MNRLRAGAVLRIPSGDEIAAVSPAEASAEVRPSRRLLGCVRGRLFAGRLRLVPPSDASASAGSGTDNSAEVSQLQGRVRELEGQLNESKRMLELRNTELADLQAKLAASQQQAAQPAPHQPPSARDASSGSSRAQATPEAAPPEAAAPASTPEPAPAPARARRRRPSTRQPQANACGDPGEGPSLLDTLMEKWWCALVAIALIVLGTGLHEVARQAQDRRIR